MSGTRQHHIWQALQRGFSWKEHGDYQVWKYTAGQPPKQTVTRLVGVEKRFYGEPDSPADLNITAFENSIQSFVQEAKLQISGTEVDATTAGALVAHLEMRSSFLRNQISQIASFALQQLKDHFSSKEAFQEMMLRSLDSSAEKTEQWLSGAGASERDKEVFRALAPLVLPSAVEEGFSTISPMFVRLLDEFSNSVPDLSKNAHIQSLVSPFSEVDRAKIHQSLRYRIFTSDKAGIVLPDTCIAFLLDGKCAPVYQKGDRVESVIVPLSASTAIIGTAKGSSSPQDDSINRALASCATEFFLAPKNTSELQRLASRIGKNAKMMSTAEIKKVLSLRSLLQSL
jgi:hypothetical protein